MSFLILERRARCNTIRDLNIKRVYKENRRKEKPDDISCTKILSVYVFLLTYISDTTELFPRNECCQIRQHPSINNRTIIGDRVLKSMTS